MRLRLLKLLALFLILLCAWGEQAWARSGKYGADPLSVPNIMVDESGTPIIMQGLEQPKKGAERKGHRKGEGAERPVNIPQGSATYVPPPIRFPAGTAPVVQPHVTPYAPPPVNSFSDRVTQCLHSFPLNAGLGNNPTGRDAYVRSCAN